MLRQTATIGNEDITIVQHEVSLIDERADIDDESSKYLHLSLPEPANSHSDELTSLYATCEEGAKD